MLKASRFLQYWHALFGGLSEEAEGRKVYILGLTPKHPL